MNGLKQQLLDANDDCSRALRVVCEKLDTVASGLLVEWAGYLRINLGRSVRTTANYLRGVYDFIAWLNTGGTGLEDVTAHTINQWQQWCYIKKMQSAKTRDLKLVAVRRFFAWREMEKGQVNPARSIQGPKHEKAVAQKYTTSQLRKIFAAPDTSKPIGLRDKAVLLFMYATGARRMELVGLNLSQIELGNQIGAVKFCGKGAKERMLTFEGPAVVVLRDWLLCRDDLGVIDQDAVFVGLSGAHKSRRLKQSGYRDILYRAAKTARMRNPVKGYLGLHKMRVTFATDMYDDGVDLETLRILMGHEDINTTRQYLAISQRQISTRMPSTRQNELLGKIMKEPAYVTKKRQQLTGR